MTERIESRLKSEEKTQKAVNYLRTEHFRCSDSNPERERSRLNTQKSLVDINSCEI